MHLRYTRRIKPALIALLALLLAFVLAHWDAANDGIVPNKETGEKTWTAQN